MKKNLMKWLLLACSAMALGEAQGSLITFDDLSGSQSAVPAGYGGLVWENFYYITYTDFGVPDTAGGPLADQGSGYYYGRQSGDKVIFNGWGSSAAMQEGTFTLTSAYMTAAWRDDLPIRVVGKLGNVVVYDNTYTLSATIAKQVVFNYVGVSSVVFEPVVPLGQQYAGVKHVGFNGDGNHFVMDNIVVQVVPEPSTWAAGAMLLAPLALAGIRKFRRG